MADAFEHCEQLVRAGDKDRFLATLFAPPKYRRALLALYAFNLEVARTRELAREPMPGEMRLQWWRDALAGTAWGEAGAHPVAAALRDVLVRYGLPLATLTDLVDARSFDLYDEPFPDVAALERYAERTSSTLIALAARILCDGRDAGIGDLARHAGIAYAITGLLRALPLQAARGQLFLPADMMRHFGVQPADVWAARATPELCALLAALRQRVREHLASARERLDATPPAVAPALLPLAVVRPALARMERRSNRPFEREDVPQWRRQWALWRAARSDLRTAF